MTEIKKCKECQSEISVIAKRCPNCRTIQGTWTSRNPIGTVLIVLIGIFWVYSAVSNNSKNNQVNFSYESTSVFKPYTATVDNSKLAGTGITDINVWNSYSDRTLKFKLQGDETVKVTSKERTSNYCRISHDNQSGWLSCDWLK